jgi:hypothetical protein
MLAAQVGLLKPRPLNRKKEWQCSSAASMSKTTANISIRGEDPRGCPSPEYPIARDAVKISPCLDLVITEGYDGASARGNERAPIFNGFVVAIGKVLVVDCIFF